MDNSGSGKSPNSSLSFRYNANNEELEELYPACEDDPPTPQFDISSNVNSESASPKKVDKTASIIDKYFKSIRVDKFNEKLDEGKNETPKAEDTSKSGTATKEVNSSPVKDYLNRLGKRSASSDANADVKDSPNETWKIFHDFKFKISQAVEDIKSRSVDEPREKSVPRDNSISDSEENSVVRDSDQHSVGDTDNQVSSLDSSIQNLSELTQAVTTKANDGESSLPIERSLCDDSDDTHKNMVYNVLIESEKNLLDDTGMMEVESGVEALEESNMDEFVKDLPIDTKCQAPIQTLTYPEQTSKCVFSVVKNNIQQGIKRIEKPKTYFFTSFMIFLTGLLMISYTLLSTALLWNGFLLGLWVFYFVTNLKRWVLDTFFSDWDTEDSRYVHSQRNSSLSAIYHVPSVKEHRPLKKYEGWINHYRHPEYNPYTYHINKTTTAFMKLEGCNLRLSYTQIKIGKRALWDEKIESVSFYQHRFYNLTGAKLLILPKDLVRKRHWSKKYPICIVLSDKEKIQVLEKEPKTPEKKQTEIPAETKSKEQVEHVETSEANTSPEKKKKFIWRRRDKANSQTETETSKEGLRQRFVRRMHRDKKTENASTSTDSSENLSKNAPAEDASFYEPNSEYSIKSLYTIRDEDEDIDENELSRIKDFLDESELEGSAEGEWTIHVKNSRDKHSRLFLFGRTGREKHEWYRRLNTAIMEAKATSADSSAAEEGPPSDAQAPAREVEMAVYKVHEKEAIAFTKPTSKVFEAIPEVISVTSTSQPLGPSDWESYEKTFWPYLLKIIQSHETNTKTTSDIGVMCQIDPSPKHSKRRKSDPQKSSKDCDCRSLSPEVTWINAVLARVMYDVMRDPNTIVRVQNRIQRKLNTLKLPSFMSPLVVTELSLGGACPLVERVGCPTWDERGVWLDADLKYDGGAYISLLTQINLMKLKEKSVILDEAATEKTKDQFLESVLSLNVTTGACVLNEQQLRERKPAIYDSDVEDSAESSSDDETPPLQPVDSGDVLPLTAESLQNAADGGSSKKKFLRMVDKIATNKYFQQVTDYKYVKRAMEGLSNTDIRLQVEICQLDGRLAVNLPPPPHDRIWIGFRTNPQLVLKARPAVGARAVRFAHITNWIEEKLSKEFEKVFVLPNMEDIVIDFMTPTPINFE